MMRIGDCGAEVAELQKKLAELGLEVTVDGAFGPITRWAVLNVQAMFGLKVDGVVGPATAALIDTQRAYGWNLRRPNAQRWALKAQGLLVEELEKKHDPRAEREA